MKFLRIGFVCFLILLAGLLLWRGMGKSDLQKSHVIKMRILENQWKFSPDNITIPANQEWDLRIYNEDAYSHGFFIQALGINQELLPHTETVIKIKSEKSGQYAFYCSVICGAGHYRMTGQLNVQ